MIVGIVSSPIATRFIVVMPQVAPFFINFAHLDSFENPILFLLFYFWCASKVLSSSSTRSINYWHLVVCSSHW